MIQIEELRIGNFLQNKNLKAPVQVGTINSDKTIKLDYGLCKNIYTDRMTLLSFQGVPLTEEWLKKFGFFIVETNKCVEAFKENFRYSIQQVDNSNQWFWCDGETVITNLEFVHELQNLYFCLTRNDLLLVG